MSLHPHHPWQPGEEITEKLINGIAFCINGSRRGMRFTPPMYGIFSPADLAVYNIAKILDTQRWNKNKPEEFEKAFREACLNEQEASWLIDIALLVFPKIEIPDYEAIEKHFAEMAERIKNMKFTMPNISKPFPPLLASSIVDVQPMSRPEYLIDFLRRKT